MSLFVGKVFVLCNARISRSQKVQCTYFDDNVSVAGFLRISSSQCPQISAQHDWPHHHDTSADNVAIANHLKTSPSLSS